MRRLVCAGLFLVTLSACSDDESESDDKTSSQETKKTRRTSEDKPAGADSAKQAFEQWRTAVLEKDWAALFELTPPSYRQAASEKVERQKEELKKDPQVLARAAKELGLQPDELLEMSYRDLSLHKMERYSNELAPPGLEQAVVEREQVESSRCTVTIKSGGEIFELVFVQEDGRWFWRDQVRKGKPTPRKPSPLVPMVQTVVHEGVEARAGIPKGWKRSKFGNGWLLTKTDGLYTSKATLGFTAHGSARTLKANLASVAADQKKAQDSYYRVNIVEDSEPEPGKYLYVLELREKQGQEIRYQIGVTLYQDGWPLLPYVMFFLYEPEDTKRWKDYRALALQLSAK